MIYLRRLAHLFQHQHLTMTGVIDGKRLLIMTDRRLTLVENNGPSEEDDEMRYIDSFTKDSLNPMEMLENLDDAGCPIIPVGSDMVTAGEDTEHGGKGKVIPPEKTWDLINTTMAGTYTFALPAGVEACKDDWLAFRFSGGKLYIRSANDYEDLLKSTEVVFDVTYSNEIEDDTCFAVKTELVRVCKELAGDNVVISVKRTQSTYIGIRTPDLTCVFFCPPLTLKENLKVSKDKEEIPEAPENQETEVDAIPGNEEVAETEVIESEAETVGSEATEEATDPEETETTTDPEETEANGVATEPTTEGGTGAEDKPPTPAAAEDVDPLEAYDILIPDILKAIQETVKVQGNEAKRLLKNATKQSRRALKSQSDPEDIAKLKSENASLKKALSIVEHQRDAAKKALKDIL